MVGAEAVIKTRMARKKPKVVFVDADGYSAVKPDIEPLSATPDVIIFPQERLSELDLRFVVGLTVSVSGFDHKRVTAVGAAMLDAKAERVICNYMVWETIGGFKRVKLEQVIDTEGSLNWESNDW